MLCYGKSELNQQLSFGIPVLVLFRENFRKQTKHKALFASSLIAMSTKKVLVLFDVDGTLTEPREDASPEMKSFLQTLRNNVTVGIVGGSDLIKQEEQLGNNITKEVDYSFSENGLVAYKNGALIGKEVSDASPLLFDLERLLSYVLCRPFIHTLVRRT